MRVAPQVKLLRRAADEDRDRLERQLCLACRLGGVGLLGLGRLGGVLGRRGSVELGLDRVETNTENGWMVPVLGPWSVNTSTVIGLLPADYLFGA
jgi:hypothetical protein